MNRSDRIDLDAWIPRGVDERAGSFARAVVAEVDPPTWARARSLLWSASRLCAFALACGHEPEPAVVLSGALIERFIVGGTPTWSSAARRTVRSNLYFLARRVKVRALEPVPLARGRAQAPYCEAELAAYLSLADAQPTLARCQRASGLIALGAGAGLLGADLRLVTGTDVLERSGGVVVSVAGRCPRVVPVRKELARIALDAAAWAGSGFIVGGAEPSRRNVTSPLIASLARGPDLPRLSLARLRSTWLSRCAADIGLATFMAAAGVVCSQRLGDVVAHLDPGDEEAAVALLGGRAVKEHARATYEAIVEDSGVAADIEARLPVGVRPRQLSVGTLLIGILITSADGRPAHLRRLHRALLAQGEEDRRRLGVVVEWKRGPHLLTYRQVERTFSLVVTALSKETPDGTPTEVLQKLVDRLVEASLPAEHKDATRSLAIDWTDVESFARPPVPASSGSKEKEAGLAVPGAPGTEAGGTEAGGTEAGDGRPSADPEASWGHRRGDGPGQRDELFYGYYLGLATMVREERGPEVPELVRRMGLSACHVDPVPFFVPVLENMVATGVPLGDTLADSGYSHRVPGHWALPLRALGANLVMDLHPHDRGRQGTYQGAICWNGSLYCPSTPMALFDIEPLSRRASAEETATHDARAAELDRYRFSVLSGDDADGHHRVMCPAAAGKLRCPRRAGSMALSYSRPEIFDPPEHPPTCCAQVSITVPPSVNAKTRQKHPYPSAGHRSSYARRSGAERANSTIKDPASNDVGRGWCRLTGLVPMTLMVACVLVVRNQRVLESFAARQANEERRAARGLAPRTRRRRRTTNSDLVGTSANAPP